MRTTGNHRTRRGAVAVVLALATLGVAPPAPAAEIDPNDFDVQVDMGEGFNAEPTCDESGLCTFDVDVSVYNSRSDGTVTAISKNLDGTIRMICDYRDTFAGTFQMGESGEDWTALDARMRMGCAWYMSYEDGSTLSGMIDGLMTMALVGDAPDTVAFTGSFTVQVVAGTGEFVGYVGTGTFEESFTEVWGGGGPPADGGPAAPIRSAFAVRTAEDPGMQTELVRTGGFRVRVVTPRARLPRSDGSAKLRVVAARGATCSARAVKGDVVKSLGSSEDANRDGILTFDPVLTSRLARGDWSLRVRCSGRVGGAAKSASVTRALEIT